MSDIVVSLLLIFLDAFFFSPKFTDKVFSCISKGNKKDFPSLVFWAFINFLFLSPAYLLLLKKSIAIFREMNSIYSEIFIIAILSGLTFRWFLPGLVSQKSRFSVQIKTIYAFFSLLFLSMIYVFLFFSHVKEIFCGN
jgi:hypothetical protein